MASLKDKVILITGNIVNISSIAGSKAAPSYAAYSISKAALDHLTKITAMEVAQQGVRVNSVKWGFLKEGSEWDFFSFLELAKERHPLGHPGTTTDVAKAIVFLASDESSFTTGHLLFVDGGRIVKS